MKPEATSLELFPAREHDHAHCIDQALCGAAVLCGERGARFTALRRRVLQIIWQSHKPLGAYAILERLSWDGRPVAPPTVYRALNFLLEHGLVHRIASLNAYVGCRRPGHGHPGQFLVCEGCGDAAELTDVDIQRAVRRGAAAQGFAVERCTVEVAGRCPNCQ